MKCCICGSSITEGYEPFGLMRIDHKLVYFKDKDRCCEDCYRDSVLPCKIWTYIKKKGLI